MLTQGYQAGDRVHVAAGQHDAHDGEERNPRFGCKQGVYSICWRKSGDALSRNQSSSLAQTATDAWVRGLAAVSPVRARRQAGALEFHCGNASPAARHLWRCRRRSAGVLCHEEARVVGNDNTVVLQKVRL
jgi:hypothetical protein